MSKRDPSKAKGAGADVGEKDRLRFAFECLRTWDSLPTTTEPTVRQCHDCDKSVHLSRDAKEASEIARVGRCVAVPTAMVRSSRGSLPTAASTARGVLVSLRALLRKLTARREPPKPARAAPSPPPRPAI